MLVGKYEFLTMILSQMLIKLCTWSTSQCNTLVGGGLEQPGFSDTEIKIRISTIDGYQNHVLSSRSMPTFVKIVTKVTNTISQGHYYSIRPCQRILPGDIQMSFIRIPRIAHTIPGGGRGSY